jgi:hypothetical protein
MADKVLPQEPVPPDSHPLDQHTSSGNYFFRAQQDIATNRVELQESNKGSEPTMTCVGGSKRIARIRASAHWFCGLDQYEMSISRACRSNRTFAIVTRESEESRHRVAQRVPSACHSVQQ